LDFRFDADEVGVIEEARRAFAHHVPRGRLLEPALGDWPGIVDAGWLRPAEAELPFVLVVAVAREAGRVLAGDAYVNNAVVLRDVEAPAFPVGFDGRWCYGVEPGFAAVRVDDGALFRDWTLRPAGDLALATGEVELHGEPEAAVPVEGDGLEAAVAHAGALVGAGEQALADTVAYVKDRRQFGGPVGRFQSLKHGLADVAVELEIAWNAMLYAALALDGETAAIARLQASRAAEAAVRTLVQFHGGIAITWEHHAHLTVKSVLTGLRRFGTEEEHARALGERLLRA
jgi:alkylation response protein AidB-like acyl-CoA dehydrogenase